MSKMQISGYRRVEDGKVGGFEPVDTRESTHEYLAGNVDAILKKLPVDPQGRLVLQLNKQVLAITPAHNEQVDGFETHPFTLAVKPMAPSGVPREFNTVFVGQVVMVVDFNDAGRAAAKLLS